jgi:AcrR family transcriptional regulator
MTEPAGPRRTMRELNQHLRLERYRAFRQSARKIIADEGLTGLTMQRVADDVGCAVGSLYRYFASKDALLAELQRDAIDRLGTSFLLSQSHLDELLDRRRVRDGRVVALARVVTATRFWIAAETVFPQEIELSRRMFTDPVLVMDRSEVGRVVPAGMRLLELATGLLDAAADDGAIRPATNADRAVMIIAGTTGVLMTSGLGRWNVELFDGRRLANRMARDLFLSWGADPGDLDLIDDLIATLSEHDRLVPPIAAMDDDD